MRKLLQSVFRMRFGSRMKQFEGIPGPTPSYPFGTLLEFRGTNPWEVCANYGKEYGGMTLVWLGGRPTLILNDPELIGEVLVTKFDDYYKDYPIKALLPVLKTTLFNLNPPEWTRMRKAHPAMMEGFNQWLPTQFPVVKKVVDSHLDAIIGSGSDVMMIDKMQRLFFDIINACIVGPDFENGGFDNFYILTEMSTLRMAIPQALLFPSIRPSYHRAMRLHYGAYEKAVQKARQNPDSDANDLLTVYLQHGSEVQDAQLVVFLANFQAGGDVSASAAIVNTLHLLNCNPDIADELCTQLRGLSPDYDLQVLEECTLLDHVLRESLRVLPPVHIWARNVRKDKSVTLGDREIPPNTPIYICTPTVQRSASHWQDPDTFDPGRWANGGAESNPIGSDYFFPFGRGPRICPGTDMIMFCMKIVLASMLSRADVTTSGSFKGVLHCGVIEAPELKARLTPHSGAASSESPALTGEGDRNQ